MFGRIFRFAGFLILLTLLGAVVAISLVLDQARRPGPLTAPKIVIIEPRTPTQKIAEQLERDQVIASAPVFYATLMAKRQWGALQAGEYEFAAGASVRAVIDQMAKGQVYQRKLTIPEGLSVWEIKKILAQTEGLEGEIRLNPEEGRLLPETYLYTRGTTRDAMIARMMAEMDKVVTPLFDNRLPNFPLKSVTEVLTLASIVEKETGQADERPQVASVFFNRLQVGMKLQSDPTVIYGMIQGQGPLGRELLIKDLEQTDSPYNTYKYAGLPPGPIANPGRASIEAVFRPAQTDYFYFVADGTGGHAFARTLDEHNANVARWREFERQQKQANPAGL